MNLLADRLRFAKRELTALKTAHRRGLGLLKVYTKTYSVPPYSGTAWFYWLTIKVNYSVSPYPFTKMYFDWDSFYDSIGYEASEFEYKNNGYNAEFRTVVIRLDVPYKITIYSTSPIESITHEWSDR